MRLKGPGGGIYVFGEAERLSIAVLLADNGSTFPVLSEPYASGDYDAVSTLRELNVQQGVHAYKPSACLGAASHVAALESAMEWTPTLDVEYDAMCLDPTRRIHIPSPAPVDIARYRRATLADLDELYPLAAAYEKSEVMTSIHAFDPTSCRASQARSLSSHVVYLGIVRGHIVARAQTNARGWATDQIGGVYVKPEFRGLGLGRGVVSSLVSDIATRSRHVSLFVKKTNTVALSLYRSMGFNRVTDYRVSYF